MRSPRQVAKAPLVVAAQAHQVPVPLPVVVRAVAALQAVQAVVLDLAQAVQQVVLVAELLAVQVVPQAELLAVQPEALQVVQQVQLAVLRQVVPRVRQRPEV